MMRLRGKYAVAVGFVGVLSTGCSGSPAGTSDASEKEVGDPDDTCVPTAEEPCIDGIAEPCPGIDSGFDGDEFCLAAPDPNTGYQLHVGPSDYTNPDEIAKYVAEPGVETNWAETKAAPNDAMVYWDGYYSSMRPGSHHFILFALDQGTAAPTTSGPSTNGDGTEAAVGAVGGTFIAGATRTLQNALTYSGEDEGVATETYPHQNLAMNLHFINTADHPLLQEIWVNFHVIPEADVRAWKRAITWYGGLAMNIPPQTSYTLESGETCPAPANATNLRIQGVTGHVHANTLEYSASMHRDGQTTLLFQDFDWHEPREWRFASDIDNGVSDPTNKTAGAYSGPLAVQPTDVFSWECEGFNQANVNLTFSNKVYDGEMCNVFGFYRTDTREAGPWLCAFF
jgi:hypothetical protein